MTNNNNFHSLAPNACRPVELSGQIPGRPADVLGSHVCRCGAFLPPWNWECRTSAENSHRPHSARLDKTNLDESSNQTTSKNLLNNSMQVKCGIRAVPERGAIGLENSDTSMAGDVGMGWSSVDVSWALDRCDGGERGSSLAAANTHKHRSHAATVKTNLSGTD